MEIILLIKALILGIVEGLTEFLPISSTGHLIIAGDLLDYNDDFAKVFEIVIQLAAILAVCWAYRGKLIDVTTGLLRRHPEKSAVRFVLMLFLAFLPAAVLGLIFHKFIKDVLFNPLVVATALIVGGLIILFIERPGKVEPAGTEIDDIDMATAVKVGFAQALAMIPGTSRSGATIIGGMIFGLSRKAATEFSFFLAIPTMLAATVYDVYKSWGTAALDASRLPELAVGCVVSFISAMWAVRFLLRFISTHTFVSFAWYRIVFGVVVLATAYFGWVDWSVPT
ncbi:MAG: undecaprenyl-diphosphate phosphatase [Azoarcus sp.]|jgi:undecaprenyl-diphosphatase|nr:undecaprenyl-diphosphate phosphatase [Azoarcus sp.]